MLKYSEVVLFLYNCINSVQATRSTNGRKKVDSMMLPPPLYPTIANLFFVCLELNASPLLLEIYEYTYSHCGQPISASPEHKTFQSTIMSHFQGHEMI